MGYSNEEEEGEKTLNLRVWGEESIFIREVKIFGFDLCCFQIEIATNGCRKVS
jgi:hypothetical protein